MHTSIPPAQDRALTQVDPSLQDHPIMQSNSPETTRPFQLCILRDLHILFENGPAMRQSSGLGPAIRSRLRLLRRWMSGSADLERHHHRDQ